MMAAPRTVSVGSSKVSPQLPSLFIRLAHLPVPSLSRSRFVSLLEAFNCSIRVVLRLYLIPKEIVLPRRRLMLRQVRALQIHFSRSSPACQLSNSRRLPETVPHSQRNSSKEISPATHLPTHIHKISKRESCLLPAGWVFHLPLTPLVPLGCSIDYTTQNDDSNELHDLWTLWFPKSPVLLHGWLSTMSGAMVW